MISRLWYKIPPYLRNKYAITTIVFLVWMLFFDQNDIITQIKLKSELYQINKEKAYYLEQIHETQQDLENLLNDNEKLEKFAREKYLMKKDNEDIFVIVTEE